MNYRGNIRDAWHELDADGSGKAGTLDIARLWDIETASRPRSASWIGPLPRFGCEHLEAFVRIDLA